MKTLVFIALFLPAFWMANEFFSGRWDFPSPYVLLIYNAGLWTTYLLLLGLLVTPARKILALSSLLQVRRMIGVAAFGYALLHIVAWLGLRFWNSSTLVQELLERPSLWVATITALGLAPLCATSFNAAIRKVGSLAWSRLHSAIYFLTGLAVLHFLMSPGSIQGVPFTMAGAYFWLMVWRLLDRGRRGTDWPALILLALGAGLFTLFLEPIWLATFQAERSYYPPLQVLAANFTTESWDVLGVPPVWQILAAGLLAALASVLRALVLSSERVRPQPSA